MMKNRTVAVLFAVAIAFFAGQNWCAAEQIDEPGYAMWAKFKPGSTSMTVTENNTVGQKTRVLISSTLMAVTPEKVTLEVKTEAEVAGTKLPPRVTKREVPAKREKPPGERKINEKTENVTLAGKTYSCKLSEETRGTMRIKLWASSDVPGGVVKMEMSDEGSSMKTTLVDYGIKK